MKLKTRRLFAFFLALLFFVPAGMPAAAQGDAENKADLLAQVAIESSGPDGDGVYTMDFSVKPCGFESFSEWNISEATFIFSYDPSIVSPVDATSKEVVTIGDKDTTSSSFVSTASEDFNDLSVVWAVKPDRVAAKVTLTTKNTYGIPIASLKKIFSFSYKFISATQNGSQDMFRIEKDSQDGSFLSNFLSMETDNSRKSNYGGIFFKYSKTGMGYNYYSSFNANSGSADSIILTRFSYPGCAGITSEDMQDINIYKTSATVSIPDFYADAKNNKSTFIATAKNADGVYIPFTEGDSLSWDFACADEKVEALRKLDQNNSIHIEEVAKGTITFVAEDTAAHYHRQTLNYQEFLDFTNRPSLEYYKYLENENNRYDITLEVNTGAKTLKKISSIPVSKAQYDSLSVETCKLTGPDVDFTYQFEFVPDLDSHIDTPDICVIPKPAQNQTVTYNIDFDFWNYTFDEQIKPQARNHFYLVAKHPKDYTSKDPNPSPTNGLLTGPVTLRNENSTYGEKVIIQLGDGKTITSYDHATMTLKNPSTGYYSIWLIAKSGRSHAPQMQADWKMDFFITDFKYDWPDRFTKDDTPLIMKPEQTYNDLLAELTKNDTEDHTFFNQYATDLYDPSKILPGTVVVMDGMSKPDPSKDNNYVTFKFMVTDNTSKYVEYRKPVKIASLPTGPISATITQVDGKDYNGQPIELEVTRSQLVNAGDLQALGFPSTVTLSWDGGSTQVSGNDLKFDAALAVLQALNVGDTKDVSLQTPADNITLANGLTVKVKVVPTGLGAGAGTVTLPGGSYTYTGSPLTPAPAVTVGGVTLTKDTDYTVEYRDNVNAGTGKIIITGKGNYSGTIETDFTINKASLPGVTVDGADLTAGKDEYTAQAGDVLTPKFENGLDPSVADWVWKEKDSGAEVSNKRVYVPKAADAGKEIYAQAAAKPNSNYTGTAQSLPVKILIPISGSVYIKADPTSGGGGAPASIGPGTELTAVITPVHPSAVTWDYQWKKNGADIAGATGKTYTLKDDDVTPDGAGNSPRITVSVTPTTGSPATGGLTSEDAVTVGKKPLDVGTVTVTKESPGGVGGVVVAQPGDKLIASVTPAGGGEAPANPPYKFVWIKDGTPIDGEEGPEYTLKPGDKGKEITVAVVPKDDDGDYTGTVPNTSPIQVPPTKPGSPENVTVTPGSGGGSVKVSWDPPADDGGEPIEEYKVVVKDGDGKTVAEVPVNHDKKECEVPVPDGDKEYKAEVVAVNNVGDSDPATPADPAKPDPKPTSKPGSGGGGYIPWKPTPKPSPSPDPTSSPSPGPTTSPSPSPDPWPSDCPRDETCPIAPFPDSNPKAWYHDGLHFCTGKDLMNGYANGLLGPNDPMTRAQLAMILYNMEDRPDNSGLSGFTDVPSDAWYAKAVTWANEEQVMVGYDNGCFGPNDPVTREQMTATLHRYAGSPPAGGSLEQFTDWREVSDYAKESMAWAVGEGLVSGIGNNRLSPRGTSTRAQVGTIIYLYCKLVSYPGA